MRALLFPLLAALIMTFPSVAASDPSPVDHYYAGVLDAFPEPTGLRIVIVPALYAHPARAELALTDGPVAALVDDPATRAALEAVDYWAWALDHYEAEYPALAHITFTARLFGVDATEADLAEADIVVAIGPSALLGGGVTPSPMTNAWLTPGDTSDDWRDKCVAVNLMLIEEAADPMSLRNIVLHEVGHCLGAGHTGIQPSPHCTDEGTCYDPPTHDVMAYEFPALRKCISNLNAQSIAEAYAWTSGAAWAPNDGRTFMAKTDYAQTCMPASLARF